MKAELIDLTIARERLAAQIAEGVARNQPLVRPAEARRLRDKAARESEAEKARSEWLADLEGWPKSFRERLAPLVRRRISADYGEDESHGSRVFAARRDGHGGGGYYRSFFSCVRRSLADLQAAALVYRTPRCKVRAAEDLEDAKAELLLSLWSWGRRRISRAELEPIAREDLAEDLASAERYSLVAEKECARLEQRLAGGRHLQGVRKGRPYSRATRDEIARALKKERVRLTEIQRYIAYLRGEADPMRACGLYPRRP